MIRWMLVVLATTCTAAPVTAHHKPGVTHEDIRLTCYTLGMVYGPQEETRCLIAWGL